MRIMIDFHICLNRGNRLAVFWLITDSALCSPLVCGPNIAVGGRAIVNEEEIYQQCLWLPESQIHLCWLRMRSARILNSN